MTPLRPVPVQTRATGLAFVAGIGTMLLILGEMADRLEANLGFGVLNLTLSTLVAALATCVGALLGDTMLRVVADCSGWRCRPHAAMSALIVVGWIDAAWLLATHLSRPMRLDGWIALVGGVLLMIAGIGLHQSAPLQSARLSARGATQQPLAKERQSTPA